MKERAWEPTSEDYEFIFENICMISPQEMADHFKVSLTTLNSEKVEAGIIIDDHMAASISCFEYELDRFLNRKERASQWHIGLEFDLVDFTDRALKNKKELVDNYEKA